MVNHSARIGGKPAHRSTKVRVDLHDLFNRAALEQWRLDALLYTENHALLGGDAHGGGAKLDRLKRILHLEETPLGREGVHTAVCTCVSTSWALWRCATHRTLTA